MKGKPTWGRHGHYKIFSLWHTVRYIISFMAMAYFEWFLIKTLLKMKEEQKRSKKRKENR